MGAFIAQFAVVAMLGVRTLPTRIGASVMTLVGIAGVVAALLVVLSIASGLDEVMLNSGARDAVVVMQAGSGGNEMASTLELPATRAILEAPGIRRQGERLAASAEMFVVVDVPKKSTGTDAHVPLRGVQAAAPFVRDGFRIVSGRSFEPGKNELIVGSSALRQYEDLEIGSVKKWGDVEWTVVGIFTAGGSVAESEIWCDVHVLQPIYHQGSAFQTLHARLASADAFAAFEEALSTDVRTGVVVSRYSDYYGGQSTTLTATLRSVGSIIALLMGVCAGFGALNTMYAAVAARSREIATLRALGFSAAPTVISVLIESLTLAGIGGLLGGAIAFVGFNGLEASTMNWATYTQVAFSFQVTPVLLAQGVFYALTIGLVGGLFPAIRSARLPIATALREA
ncbi:MAG: ABC transporter permease [Gammaproteobacteria bacterium]|nr:ABC transporter permease [Gammaproteobacteria bacterium]